MKFKIFEFPQYIQIAGTFNGKENRVGVILWLASKAGL
jgi:hypothetical protein